MPVEIIGETGTRGTNRQWIETECQLAIKHPKNVCRAPPEKELEVQGQENRFWAAYITSIDLQMWRR
jgi:hypothetical protein